MTRARKLLITCLILGALAAVAGAGTYATFTAQAANPNNGFSSGTIVLSDKVGSGTACLSTGGGNTDTNANDSCSQAFNLTVQKPGSSATSSLITVKNEGSLDSSVFKVFAPAACTDTDASGESYHGTGSPCGNVQVTVQQTDSGGNATTCLYPSTGTTCSLGSGKTLSDFRTNHSSSTNGIDVNSGVLAAGSSAYFKISVQLPSSAGNDLQGRSASAGFTWYIAQ